MPPDAESGAARIDARLQQGARSVRQTILPMPRKLPFGTSFFAGVGFFTCLAIGTAAIGVAYDAAPSVCGCGLHFDLGDGPDLLNLRLSA
jgi:hypothetical protein